MPDDHDPRKQAAAAVIDVLTRHTVGFTRSELHHAADRLLDSLEERMVDDIHRNLNWATTPEDTP